MPTNQPPGTNPITIRVTANGVPTRSDGTTFSIIVRLPGTIVDASSPRIDLVASHSGQATFTLAAEPGAVYRVLYTDDLNAPAWTQLGPDVVAANETASFTDHASAPNRFYRVQRVQ